VTPVLLVHGNASCGAVWERVRALLDAPSEAPDLPGFGDAPMPRAPFVDIVASWVRSRPCVVVGAGMGALLALRAAVRAPEQVVGLVLVGPAGLPGGHSRFGAFGRTSLGAAILRSVGGSTGRARFLADQLGRPEEADAETVGLLLSGLRRSRAFAALAREPAADTLLRAPRVDCPVTVLWGERSGVQPVSGAEAFMERLPLHAELRIVPAAGHALALEEPAVVADAISALAGRRIPGPPGGGAP
jgi:pimeloyl-ACP methyl ester carboxylesterase